MAGSRRPRPPKVQAALVGTMVLLVALDAVAMARGPGEPEDWGVRWERPASMSIDGAETVEGGDGFTITMHLWDAQGRETEWGGALDVELADEDNARVYRASTRVGARDFTTTRQ